jgi:hypothetical protein
MGWPQAQQLALMQAALATVALRTRPDLAMTVQRQVAL